MNGVHLTGRLGRDPELKTTNSGKSVTSISIAVQDGKYRTYWLPIVAWENTAEFICKYFHKGDGIEITGKVTERKHEDRDGNKRSVVEVVAMNVGFPSESRKNNTEHGTERPYYGGNEYDNEFTTETTRRAIEDALDDAEDMGPADDSDLPF